MQILFDFFDFDRDGFITSLDVLNLIQSLPEGSLIHREVKLFSDFFIQETITRRINKRPADFFNLENFTNHLNSREYREQFTAKMLENPEDGHIKT